MVPDATAYTILTALNIDIDTMLHNAERLLGQGSASLMLPDIPLSPRAKIAYEIARSKARFYGDSVVGTEHVLLGILELGEGFGFEVLHAAGVMGDQVTQELMVLRKQQQKPMMNTSNDTNDMAVSTTPLLDTFGRDITLQAHLGTLEPVIGREKEINRLIQILARRTKNNPMLIGEAGVGKTAIVEGLAHSIAAGMVPDSMKNKCVIAMDLMRMVAGTKYRGDFEERMRGVMDEIKANHDTIILFIDEIHTVIGAGNTEGGLDASNMLKPALARGDVQCVGATTYAEYRKHIEHDPAFERRFQTIVVNPPSVEETVAIMRGMRSVYEAHHNVQIPDATLVAAVMLSERYIPSRFLPDKALDVIDEACAYVTMKACAPLPEREQNCIVTEDDVAHVIAQWTDINVSAVHAQEAERLMGMESFLKEELVGQDAAINVLSHAIRRARTGLHDPQRPIGVFLFVGPSGVGKTKCAYALSKFLFGGTDTIIRCDMSEYMERHTASRLIGAPPGYVGYGEGGQLTEAVKKKPYSVILLDEMEKAHPDVWNIFLQLFDTGVLTDGTGKKIHFKNTIIIMTSNIAATQSQQMGFVQTVDASKPDEAARATLRSIFPTEFLNRLDDIIVFRSLDLNDCAAIFDMLVRESSLRIKQKGFTITLLPEAREWLLLKGFTLNEGARPLRRLIERHIEDTVARSILENTYPMGTHLELTTDKDTIVVRPLEKIVQNAK